MYHVVSFILFIPAVLFFFTFPGIYFLHFARAKFNDIENLFLGTSLGFVVFTLLSYFFLIIIDKPILATILIFLVNIVAFKKTQSFLKNLKVKLSFLTFLIFFFGILGQMAIIAPSGTYDNEGNLQFWSAHGHDGPWHIALMEEIKSGWPFQNPVFSGNKLVNYHFFSDVAPAMFSKYLRFDNLDLYFRNFPFLFSLLLGGLVYILVKKVAKSESAAMWAVFFTYFAGSFGYVVTYIKDGKIAGESIFWATQIQSASGNPPQIISDFLVILYIYFVYLLLKNKNRTIFLAAVLVLSSLTLFKVYAAIALLGATALISFVKVLKERDLYFLTLTALSGILAALLYAPNAKGSTSFLIFEPWWYIRTMIVEPSRLNWLDHELRRQTYIFENNTKRVIYLETIGFLIFFIGNLGMRILGIFTLLKSLRTIFKDYTMLMFLCISLISIVFPLLFLQRAVASNTSQFFQYFLLIFGILAGISVSQILGKIRWKVLSAALAFAIIILSIPTQAGLLYEFYSRQAFAKIDREEMEALTYIKKSTDRKSVLLTPVYNEYLRTEEKTPPIWDWFDTSYVAAFTARRTYFDDYEQVDIMGYDFKHRKELKKNVFESEDRDTIKESLQEISPDYIYYPKGMSPVTNLEEFGVQKVFENNKAVVLKVN